MANEQAKFLQGSLIGHIISMSLTASVGLLAIFAVDVVDMIFISMLGISELAAAIGFAGTIIFFSSSMSIGLSIAAGALVAKSLGQNNPERAKEAFTHALMFGFAFTVLVSSLIWFNLHTITGWVGATGHTQDMAVGYLQIIVPTMPFLMCGIVASATLRSHGAAKLSMAATLTAGVVNAVLDPIFIFTLDMGLNGAAWASAISRVAMTIVALWPIFRRYGGLSSLKLKPLFDDFRPIANIAFPAMLANVAMPVGIAFVTRISAIYGEEAVAGMAIIARLTPISFALIFAMSGAIGPIIGQNFGARNFDRVEMAYRQSVMLVAIYVSAMVLLLYLLRSPIADAFNAVGTTRDLIYLFCGPLSLAWIFTGIIFVSNAAYNNLGHPYYATWVNWGRNTLGIAPVVYVTAKIWGAEGVLIGQMLGGVLVAIVAFILARKTISDARKLDAARTQGPAMGPDERSFKVMNHRQ
ncbi:MATE family efflux transporter [Amylibacter kogurei]|uniref:MATE family efflux transporter n=1 Tax=Paramylibacter kogurei TaxID=1889778 RepID=A0A2G5K9X8_9RHOB|nr:MATE family efflux transporter [Amylibacter kogurei]PIB25969.1 MATE family efflux transporter [Amylibacter kogurei]